MNCKFCNNEISNAAKFCKFCGKAVSAETASGTEKESPSALCPECHGEILEKAKFCKHCGAKIEAKTAEEIKKKPSQNQNIDVKSNYITWRLIPGELAIKIEESDVAAYKTVKGVYIAPGTQALIFVNGRFVDSLDSGTYSFDEYNIGIDKSEKKKSGMFAFLRGIASRKKKKDNVPEKNHIYSVVLVRGTEFPLVYELENVGMANLRANISLHILCKISNLNTFFEAHLTDRKLVSIKEFADNFYPIIKNEANVLLVNKDAAKLDTDTQTSNELLAALQNRLANVYPYIAVSQIITLSARNEELERIRELKEDLYVAELELEQLRLRNEYLNRMQSVEHTSMLEKAREDVDFQALMDKIDEDRLLNFDKRNQFIETLRAEATLRQAKTESEQMIAIDKLTQTTLLSKEELNALARLIRHREGKKELEYENELILATLQNEIIQDREKLRWEVEISNKRLENEILQNRMTDAYIDERRRADLEALKERRSADLDFEKQRADNKLDLLKQAQELRMQREDARHRREMEAEKQKYDADLEKQKIMATMTFEQIMASNPSISPDAAAALAKKFEAEALAMQNDRTAELVMQHEKDLKDILMQQMELTGNIIAGQSQAQKKAIEDKQRELERIHEDSENYQDRFLAGMQTTVNAVTKPTPSSAAPTMAPVAVFCPNCGKKFSKKTLICDECGTSI